MVGSFTHRSEIAGRGCDLRYPAMAERQGPLTGIRVLELGSFIAGPFAGQLLGDYGADVIKVESPDRGDPMRHWGVTTPGGDSLWWPAIGRNKRSVAADLSASDGLDLVQRLARHSDVIVENFRPGRLSKWGLDYATLSVENPGLVMVHVSGFGQTGPRSSEPGFGSVGEAVGGIRHTTGDPDRPPARCGISLGDSLAGLFAVIGALAALSERSSSGRGQEVDVAIYEAVAALMESTLADYEVGGVERTRSGGTLPGVAPANAYPAADGSDVLLAGNADGVFTRLTDLMGQPQLATDERFATHAARGAHAAELDALVAHWTVTLESDALLDALSGGRAGRAGIYGRRRAQRSPVPGQRHGASCRVPRRGGGADGRRRAALRPHSRCRRGCRSRPGGAHLRGAGRAR